MQSYTVCMSLATSPRAMWCAVVAYSSIHSWPTFTGTSLRILFLFTKSDFATILLPVTVFAVLSTPGTDIGCLLAAVFWTWLHLLQFCISNQMKNTKEDAANKPWRPIPSKLIEVDTAGLLRWTLFPICLCLSAHYGVIWPGVLLSAAFITHNELGLDGHWLLRHMCNSWGYAMFNAGAASIANPAADQALKRRTASSLVCNALIILTTIHAQDFRDQEGDKLSGRRTLPILFPEASRVAIVVMMVGWAVGLSVVFGFRLLFAAPFVIFSMVVGLRFYFRRLLKEDRSSYLYYNVCTALLIPSSLIFTGSIPREDLASDGAGRPSAIRLLEDFVTTSYDSPMQRDVKARPKSGYSLDFVRSLGCS